MIMPRSGGDYVRVSRTLSPFFGFFSNFSPTFVFLTWIALTALFAAPLEASEWKN
jgi:basic amino acid/polyamine antiporter, APA family